METYYPVLLDTFLFDKHSVQETVILLYVCVYNIISFCGYQNVDMWYIGFLFFTRVVFFLHRQNVCVIGVGQGI